MTIDTRLERIQQICDAVATDHFGPDGGRVEVVGIDGPAGGVGGCDLRLTWRPGTRRG